MRSVRRQVPNRCPTAQQQPWRSAIRWRLAVRQGPGGAEDMAVVGREKEASSLRSASRHGRVVRGDTALRVPRQKRLTTRTTWPWCGASNCRQTGRR